MKLPRWIRVVGAIGLAYVVGFLLLPYYSLGPGPARQVQPRISVEGAQTYPSAGRFVMTTVEFRQLTAVGAAFAWLDPSLAVVTEGELFPAGGSPAQEERRAISQMDTSKIDATSVVLRELEGYPEEHGEGALIREVFSGCPAEGELFPGDVILSINGRRIGSAPQSKRAIDAIPEEVTIRFEIKPLGEERSQRIALKRGPCVENEGPLLGISTIGVFPIEVAIRSGDVGGPSAGLMWALGLYDVLTPGDLTGGRTIAGTGAIGPNGEVFPIGGIEEKVVAAEKAGATVLLVPRGNLADAREAGVGGVRLAPVGSFDEALTFLRGDSSPA